MYAYFALHDRVKPKPTKFRINDHENCKLKVVFEYIFVLEHLFQNLFFSQQLKIKMNRCLKKTFSFVECAAKLSGKQVSIRSSN